MLAHLRDDSTPAFVPDTLSTVFFNTDAMNVIRQAMPYPWLTFSRHDSPACTSAPLGEGPEADRALITATEAAFLAKKPRPEIGANYGTSWLLEVLLVKYSDVTDERIASAIERAGEGSLVVTRYPDGRVDGIGVRKGSALARLIETRS